jgi:hypothetical protein
LLYLVIIVALLVFIFSKCHSKEPDLTYEIDAVIYLVAHEGSAVVGETFGCNDILVGVTKKLKVESSGIEAALNELILQPDTPELHNFVKGPRLFLLKVLIANNRAEVYLKGDFNISAKCDTERIRQQLYKTASQFDEYKDVKFYISDLTLEKYLSISEMGFK